MKRVCFVGASTTEGVGDRTGKGWVGNTRVAKEQLAACFNLGVRGQTIFQISERAAAECGARILSSKQGSIVLGCGLNELARLEDGTQRRARSEIMDCNSKLIIELKQIAPTVVVGPPTVLQARMPFYSVASGLSLDFRNSDIEVHDESMRDICADLNVPYISVFADLYQNKPYQTGLDMNDGLHTNAEGYSAMASIIEGSDAWGMFAQM